MKLNNSFISVVSLGFSIGTIVGIITHKLVLWVPLGIMLGGALGLAPIKRNKTENDHTV